MRELNLDASEDSSAGEVEAHVFGDDGVFPNNGKLPVLVYRDVLEATGRGATSAIRRLFAKNQWGSSWVNGIYGFHHYHSTAHEVLAVCGGKAKVQLGGKQGLIVNLSAGDAVVIPAGVAHKNLGSGSNFIVVGAYPEGQHYDMCYGEPGERPGTDENIDRVPLPESDPLRGPGGPLMQHWSG
jgi:uncharacterized protein YjlB